MLGFVIAEVVALYALLISFLFYSHKLLPTNRLNIHNKYCNESITGATAWNFKYALKSTSFLAAFLFISITCEGSRFATAGFCHLPFSTNLACDYFCCSALLMTRVSLPRISET